jgi:hypothetical protein
MQNSYKLAPEIGQAAAGAAQTQRGCPFPEIKFMRLIVWKEIGKENKLRLNAALAAQFLQTYSLPFMPGVYMDFYSRGAKLQPASAGALRQLLSHCHVVNEQELLSIEGILRDHFVDPLDEENRIDHAQVGDLNGMPALAIEWVDAYRNCKRISVYLDGGQDGTAVHEIHFYAPLESFDLAKKYFSEVLRSLQWQECAYAAA